MDLRHYLQESIKKLTPKTQHKRRREVVQEVVSVVKDFHDQMLVHCDIKGKQMSDMRAVLVNLSRFLLQVVIEYDK